VNASVSGGWDDLYKLIDATSKMDGVEITQYSYTGDGGDDSKEGGFSLTIKFYVFIEGVTGTDGAKAPAA
jgi:hypothetical protein